MAVMSRKVNLGFEVAPGKKDQFFKDSCGSKAAEDIIKRAAKNICGFENRTVKRK